MLLMLLHSENLYDNTLYIIKHITIILKYLIIGNKFDLLPIISLFIYLCSTNIRISLQQNYI